MNVEKSDVLVKETVSEPSGGLGFVEHECSRSFWLIWIHDDPTGGFSTYPLSNVPVENPQDLWTQARLVQLPEMDQMHLRGLSLSHVLL